MNNFFEYVTAGDEDKDWGLFINVAGKVKVEPEESYPPIKHPTGYYFTWQNGRILQEYQLLYITEGSGIFECEEASFQVKAGHLIIIKPGVWHRYMPNKKTGWVENYVGFNGELADFLFKRSVFSVDKPIVLLGIYEELIDTYYKIFDLVKKEEPGFQQVGSGLVIKLMGYVVALTKQQKFSDKPVVQIIQKVKFYMRDSVETGIDLHQLAKEYSISYAQLRKWFKKYTGVAPNQYFLELKIIRAKELILTTNKSIKEISFELGFESIHYFSRLFKKKTGVAPTALRKIN